MSAPALSRAIRPPARGCRRGFRLLVAEGRIDEGTALIRQLIDKSPTPPSYLAVCHVLETLGDARGVRYWARQGLSRFADNPALRKLAG